jgi:hypothetical protein
MELVAFYDGRMLVTERAYPSGFCGAAVLGLRTEAIWL